MNTDLSILTSHLDGLLERIRQSDGRLKRLQRFEAKAFTLNSLSELIEFVLEDAPAIFEIDGTSLALIDLEKNIAAYVTAERRAAKRTGGLLLFDNEEPVVQLCGKSAKPHVAMGASTKISALFADGDQPPVGTAVVPLWRRGRFLGAIYMRSADAAYFESTLSIDVLERIGWIVSVCLENCLNFELLQRTSLLDAITGVNNRLFLEQRIGEEISRTLRSGEPLACVFFDLDYFKRVNDTYGHQAGDQVLAKVAGEIRAELRNSDVLARYGGEEFVALISGCNEAMALDIAERIRARVAGQIVAHKDGSAIKVTVSAGVATYEVSGHGQDRRITKGELLACADQALYTAKRKGRNCVVSGGPVVPPVAERSRVK